MKKILIIVLPAIFVSSIAVYFILRPTGNTIEDKGVSNEEVTIHKTENSSSAGGGLISPTSPRSDNRCKGLSGELEVQVLVGPAEAVGMPPVAVGRMPFSVVTSENPYLVKGGGPITYQETMSQAWGTYTVNLEMEGTIEGECSGGPGSETLNTTAIFTGNQMIEVRAKGFQGDYPWEGTQNLQLSFPLQDGATSEGEGWVVVLHISD